MWLNLCLYIFFVIVHHDEKRVKSVYRYLYKHFWWCKLSNCDSEDDDGDDDSNNSRYQHRTRIVAVSKLGTIHENCMLTTEEYEEKSEEKRRIIQHLLDKSASILKLMLTTRYFGTIFVLFILHVFTGSATAQLFGMLMIHKINDEARSSNSSSSSTSSSLMTPKTIYLLSNFAKLIGSIILVLLTIFMHKRKIIINIGLIFNAMCFVVFALTMHYKMFVYAQVVYIFLYLCLALGYDKMLHIICSEIFAAKHRVLLTGIINFTSALLHAVAFQYFQWVLDNVLGPIYIFYVFAISSVLSVIIIVLRLPETCNFNMRK